MEFRRELEGEWIEPTTTEILLKKDKDFLVNEILFQNDRAQNLKRKLDRLELLLNDYKLEDLTKNRLMGIIKHGI